jgi:AcrR family transcriptional regulator
VGSAVSQGIALTRKANRSRTRPRPGRPRKVSRDAVVAAAVALVQEEGSAALTMRRVSARAGVNPSALYTYVRDMAEIEEAVVEFLLRDIKVPETTDVASFAVGLADMLTSVRDLMIKYPDLLPARVGSAAWYWTVRRANELLKSLLSLGVGEDRAALVYTAVIGLTTASAAAARWAAQEPGLDVQLKLLARMKPSEAALVRARLEKARMAPVTDAEFRTALQTLTTILVTTGK